MTEDDEIIIQTYDGTKSPEDENVQLIGNHQYTIEAQEYSDNRVKFLAKEVRTTNQDRLGNVVATIALQQLYSAFTFDLISKEELISLVEQWQK